MKGLFIQDYYIMRKNLIISLVACTYFLAILLIGSTATKNSAIDIVMYGMCGLIPCFLTSCACFTINFDKASKSTLYTYCHPISLSKIIAEKYALTYTLYILSYIIISIFALINHMISGYLPGKNFLFVCFIIASFILIFINFQIPITMRFGQTVASVLLILVFIGIIIAGLAIIVRYNNLPDLPKLLIDINNHKTIISIAILFIDLLSVIISYVTATKVNR